MEEDRSGVTACRFPEGTWDAAIIASGLRPLGRGTDATIAFTAVAKSSALKSIARHELEALVASEIRTLTEEEVLAILDNPYAGPKICGAIAQNQRLAGLYAVRLRLVGHRHTPQAHSVKLVHYLHWFDLLRLSVDVLVPPAVRRAIDTQLELRVTKLSTGEKIASARQCGRALIGVFLFDPDPRVLAALLLNKRLREDDLLSLASSPQVSPEHLQVLGGDERWAWRRSIRIALVLNPRTPRSLAASQLRYLSRTDLRRIHRNPEASVYVRRCIERLEAGG